MRDSGTMAGLLPATSFFQGSLVQSPSALQDWATRIPSTVPDSLSPWKNALEGLYCVLGSRNRLGILLVYHPPCCLPRVSLPELKEVISDLVVKTPRLLLLGDLNLHAEATLTGAVQNFMATMTTMGLSQHVIGLTHETVSYTHLTLPTKA